MKNNEVTIKHVINDTNGNHPIRKFFMAPKKSFSKPVSDTFIKQAREQLEKEGIYAN